MLLASLLHDIKKKEGSRDPVHVSESSFDSFFIVKKFNLSQEEEIKLNTLIKNHEWLKFVNESKSEKELEKNIQSTAYDLRHDNLFDMSLIFSGADLKAVKKDDSFYDKNCENMASYAVKIKDSINELQKSQPILPTTKLPSANEIKSKITEVNSDGSTNIKGVYEDKDGIVVIKYNEVEDGEKLGLPEGCTSRGIKTKTGKGKDVDTKYIHGGGETDHGSGTKKNIRDFKDNYIFDGKRNGDRVYISNLIKEAAGLSDEEYIEFVKKNENKSFNEVEPKELREKLIKAFASINSNKRWGDREYNEMYISNPKPMGVFAYNRDTSGTIGNPVEFLNSQETYGNRELDRRSTAERTGFLRKYALENDLPFVVFGD